MLFCRLLFAFLFSIATKRLSVFKSIVCNELHHYVLINIGNHIHKVYINCHLLLIKLISLCPQTKALNQSLCFVDLAFYFNFTLRMLTFLSFDFAFSQSLPALRSFNCRFLCCDSCIVLRSSILRMLDNSF